MNGLLHQKLHMPVLQPDVIPRPHLIARLNAALSARLILISASTGCGKTTLLTQWLQAHVNVGVGWVSLDERDNDPARFLAYLSAATAHAFGLQQEHQMVENDDPDNLIESLITLLNAISTPASTGSRHVIVLDDFHLIQNHAALTLLMTYLEHMPESMHLVISSRVDPPLALGRLRARGHLIEIRQRDLRFTLDTAAHYLQSRQPYPLDDQQVERLYMRTEGWIAGLQLASLALPEEADRRDSFIRDFAGSHRTVVDYLYDEVWQEQPDDIRAFLLATCVLDRFNVALCDAVRQRNDSAGLIDRLDRQNLFIVPLDDRREWYRYHHLFADLLRMHLNRNQPEQARVYHQRASAWFLEDTPNLDHISIAIDHALAAHDRQRTASIIETHGERIWYSGQHDMLRGWLAKLATEPLPDYPQVNILRAWLAMTAGHYAQAHRFLDELHLDTLPHVTRGRVAAVRAFLATLEGRIEDTIKSAETALEHLEDTSSHWRRTAAIALGDAHNIQGYFPQAVQTYQQALQMDPRGENPYLTLNVAFKLAGAYRQRGLLQQAYDICTRYLDYARRIGLSGTTLSGCLQALGGDIMCDWGQLDQALDKTQAALDTSQHSYHFGLLGWIYLFRLRCLLAARDFDQFDTTLALFHELIGAMGLPPWLKAPLIGLQGMRWLVADDLAAARAWVIEHNLEPVDTIQRQQIFVYLMLARFLFVQQHHATALDLTDRVLAVLSRFDQIVFRIVTHILRALIFDATEQSESAQQALSQALHLAEPGGYVQIFVEGGAPLRDLLAQQEPSDLRQKILTAFTRQQTAHSLNESPVKPLTERELDVLRLIAEGFSNQAIADSLFISLNTVLYHNKNIYSKLGVKRRTQAVQRARKLNML